MSEKRSRQEQEDYELEQAIALSLQETQSKKPRVIDVDDADEDDEDLKRAIAESLKSESSTSTASHTIIQQPQQQSQQSQQTSNNNRKSQFKLNFIAGLSASANTNTVRISDLIEKELQSAFVTAFSIDIDWFLSIFPKHVPLTLVKHYDTKVEKPGHYVLSPNMTVLHPPLPPFGNMHAKLMLLLYPKFIRVVISSSNLTMEDWYQIGQVVWHQDFPKLKPGEHKDSELGQDLRRFLASLQAKPSFLNQYDFSGATVKLIMSVPGYHTKENLPQYGHMMLRETIKNRTRNANTTGTQRNDKPPTKPRIYYQTSSLGGTEEGWLSEFMESAQGNPLGKEPAPKKSTKKDTSTDKPSALDMHIVFPSSKSVYAGSKLKVGAHMVCLASKHWSNPKFPKQLMYKTEWSDKHRDRQALIMHSKVLKFSSEGLSYVYIGSHNFTQAAWGKLQKGETQLHISNYELGVISFNEEENSDIPFKCPPQPLRDDESPHLI